MIYHNQTKRRAAAETIAKELVMTSTLICSVTNNQQ